MKAKIINALYSLSLLLFITAFGFQHNPPSGWYQQFMPDLGGRSITDIVFTDSLNGYAVTSDSSSHALILKTIDGGDNWLRNYEISPFTFNKIQFLNENTGFAGGTKLLKTSNSGENWILVNTPFQSFLNDFHVLNEDTIWFAMSEGFTGGVFRTTNGGASWTQQVNLGGQNPDKIYMYNASTGFIAENFVHRNLRKTTDGGFNWIQIPGENGFSDIHFSDSMIGWKCSVFGMKKTTDGGLTWITQTLPTGGYIVTSGMFKFSNINADTIWGTGGYVRFPNNQVRTILHRTTNGGDNWYYQIPDTSIKVFPRFISFVNKNIGWAYDNAPTGIHTKTGGDTTFYTGIVSINNEVPSDFKLHQNYPNPFNPRTVIRYELTKSADVILKVYDVTGRENMTLVNQFQQAGVYEVDYMGKFSSSGVYFYRLSANGELIDTKKMLLVK